MDQKAPSALQDIAPGCSVSQLVILPDMTLAMNYDVKKRALTKSVHQLFRVHICDECVAAATVLIAEQKKATVHPACGGDADET